jgi:hypothetical protein
MEKIHYGIHNSPQRTLVLIQINPVCTFSSPFFKISFNFILLSILRSSYLSLSVGFPHQHSVRTSPLYLYRVRAKRPIQLIPIYISLTVC